MDAASSFSGIAQRLGIFRVTPDALSGAAGLLGAGGGDPLAYTVDIDSGLRTLLGFTGSLPAARPSPLLEQGKLQQLFDKARAALRPLSLRSAHAADADFDRLNQWVPEEKEVQDYLIEIRQLLTMISDRLLAKSNFAPEQRKLYQQIIFTTGCKKAVGGNSLRRVKSSRP
jgi:hypothetical protein